MRRKVVPEQQEGGRTMSMLPQTVFADLQRVPVVFRRSKRVVLRPVEESDIPLLVRWMNDPEVTKFLNIHNPMMECGEREWFQKLHTRMDTDIVLVIVVESKPVGTIGLHRINWKDRTATTGTSIGEKEYWGKGYGTEAKMLLLDYAFNVLNLRKICSRVLEYNERSRRYGLRCGYQLEGTLKAQHFYGGRYWDELLLAVFREDWEPLWVRFAQEHGIKTLPSCES